jgi:hypothetical protein
MRGMLLLLALAGVTHADFRVDVPKSAIPASATLVSGAMVADSGGSVYVQDTGITGHDVPVDNFIHVHFALDGQLADGARVDALFLFFSCNNQQVTRTWEGQQTYLHGPALPFTFPLEGLEIECSTDQPEDFQLLLPSPHPISDSQFLRFGLPDTRNTRLRLIGLDGTVVRTLLNSSQGPGMHAVGFSTQGLPMGVYQLSLVAGGDSTGHTICLQGNPLTWGGVPFATTDEEGKAFLPAHLFPRGLTLQALDANGNSLGNHDPGLSIVLVKNGQRLAGCTLESGADGPSDYLITLP